MYIRCYDFTCVVVLMEFYTEKPTKIVPRRCNGGIQMGIYSCDYLVPSFLLSYYPPHWAYMAILTCMIRSGSQQKEIQAGLCM